MNKTSSNLLFLVIFLCLIIVNKNFGELTTFSQSQILNSLSESKKIKLKALKGIVTIKLKSNSAMASKPGSLTALTEQTSLSAKLQTFGAYRVEKMFSHLSFNLNLETPDIARIVKVNIAKDLDPISVAWELSSDQNVEYAEPVYDNQICENPNDSLFSQQFYLPQIYAPEAWDWQKGDSSIVIAIVDNGTDYTHKDLQDNVWINEAEANGITGVDDDGNGYVDDIHGWDFGSNDPVPLSISNDEGHGTATAGIACAAAANGIGIAGVSWNCKFMPIKCATDGNPSNILYGYEGIVYAVDNGADIINVSWGTPGYTRTGQDVINYAYQKGVIVVCAAGNYSEEAPLYPASYHHAVSVGAVDMADHITFYSNYGTSVDIFAPGGKPDHCLISTIPQDEYGNVCGTSFSSPLVAGVCALLLSRHPHWSPAQVTRQLFVTADDLEPLEPVFFNKMGHGRLNALRALTRPFNPADELRARLKIFSYFLSDTTYANGNNVFEKNETIELVLHIQNFAVEATDLVTLNISSKNGDVKLVRGEIGPFIFPADTTLQLSLTFQLLENVPAGVDSLTLSVESSLGIHQIKKIYFAVGNSPILLLDHDLNSNSQNIPDVSYSYFQILKTKKIPFAYWDTALSGFPDLTTLEKFPLLIFTSSSENKNLLIKQQRNIIRKYLDKGGNLFIAGQNIAYFLASRPFREAEDFLSDYLHVKFVANNSYDHLVQGVPTDVLSQNLSFQIWQPTLASDSQSPDVIEPADGASTIFTYGNGDGAAIKYAGIHKVVYFGFGLEAVDSEANPNLGDLSPIRTELLMRALNWLNFLEQKLNASSDDGNHYSKVVAKVSNIVSDVQSITLFWRAQGDVTFSKTSMTETETGIHIGEIPGQYAHAKLEYYLQLHNSYYDWYSPVGAPDSLHYIHGTITDVHEETSESFDFELFQNYPNPFYAGGASVSNSSPATAMEYSLPEPGQIRIAIYDILGNHVRTLVNARQQAGNFRVDWNGTDAHNAPAPAGMYFCRMEAGSAVKVIKLALVR